MTLLEVYGKDALEELIINVLTEEDPEVYKGGARAFSGFYDKLLKLGREELLNYEDTEITGTFNKLLEELEAEGKIEKIRVNLRKGPTLRNAYRPVLEE